MSQHIQVQWVEACVAPRQGPLSFAFYGLFYSAMLFFMFAPPAALRAGDLQFASGVVSPHAGAVFISHEPTGIDAIDIKDGRILWHSNEADRPLLSCDGKLAAFKRIDDHSLTIVLLNAREGGIPQLKSTPISLPNWCSISSANTPEFATLAKLDGDMLLLDITASGNYRGGANPTDHVVNKYTHRQHWTARVSLTSGSVTLIQTDETPKIEGTALNQSVGFGTKRFEVVTEKKPVTETFQTIEKKLQAFDTQAGKVVWRTGVGALDVPTRPKLPQ